MYDPPTGFDDLLGDAQLRPPPQTPKYCLLDVPGVGTVRARRPMPADAAVLAMVLNPNLDADTRQGYLTVFVQDLLADGEHERLSVAMITDEHMPFDSIERVGAAIATWGTARPFKAVGVLCVLAGRDWRTLRQRMSAAGIVDPLALPSMHALLDWAETLALTSFTSGDATRDKLQREQFIDSLYRPAPTPSGAAKRAVAAAPSGFDPASMEDAFDAAAAAL